MAFTSKGVKYAKACPAGYVTDLEVGFITLHIVELLVQSTKVLTMLSPIPVIRDADSRSSDTGITASCCAGIRV